MKKPKFIKRQFKCFFGYAVFDLALASQTRIIIMRWRSSGISQIAKKYKKCLSMALKIV